MIDASLVLVGLMGAGKSSVGRLLAASAGLPFVDLDERIARREGRTVGEVFADTGESGFRESEARATAELAAEACGMIIAAGGGWMTNPAARAALPDATVVWLRVGPAEAVRRLASHVSDRPLLAGSDPEARLRQILAERLPAYGEAMYTVETEGRTPGAVAREIAALAGLTER